MTRKGWKSRNVTSRVRLNKKQEELKQKIAKEGRDEDDTYTNQNIANKTGSLRTMKISSIKVRIEQPNLTETKTPPEAGS